MSFAAADGEPGAHMASTTNPPLFDASMSAKEAPQPRSPELSEMTAVARVVLTNPGESSMNPPPVGTSPAGQKAAPVLTCGQLPSTQTEVSEEN
jgi:hypothetical protein